MLAKAHPIDASQLTMAILGDPAAQSPQPAMQFVIMKNDHIFTSFGAKPRFCPILSPALSFQKERE